MYPTHGNCVEVAVGFLLRGRTGILLRLRTILFQRSNEVSPVLRLSRIATSRENRVPGSIKEQFESLILVLCQRWNPDDLPRLRIAIILHRFTLTYK